MSEKENKPVPNEKVTGSHAHQGVSGSREGSNPSTGSQDEEMIESFDLWEEGWYVEEEW